MLRFFLSSSVARSVEQLVPDYDHGYKEEFVVSSRDFEEAAALPKTSFRALHE